MKKKISIILPVYNAEKTITTAVQSLLNQKYKNYEIILINDGSLDNSDEICNKFSSEYDCVKYYKFENHGVSYTRNYGISKATGDYIMFIDSDDEYKSNALEEIVKTLDKNDYELIVFGYERIHIEKNNKVKLMQTDFIELTGNITKKQFIEKMQKKFLFNQIWNKVYKRNIIVNNNIKFDESIFSGEDYKFNINYMKVISNAVYIEKNLYKYYSTSTGLSLKEKERKIYIKLENLRVHKEFYLEQKYDLDYIDENYIYTCISGIAALVDTPDKLKARQDLKKYIENNDIHNELIEIQKRSKSNKIKLLSKILLIKNVTVMLVIARVLIILRKIYRKIKLG